MPRFIEYENKIFDVDSIVLIKYGQVEMNLMCYTIYFKGVSEPLLIQYKLNKIPHIIETIILYTTQNKFYPENRNA
jgi:hypothetical protein